jgi:hypothetical protein
MEVEEMRRLAATGWKPPIRPTAASGPSVHAAAAIEEAEGRRRALAQETRRRAEESEAAERTPLWHDLNLNPDATRVESEPVYITYSENQSTKMIPAGKDAELRATWDGGGSFTVVATVAAADFATTMEMSVQTSGHLDNREIPELSINTAGQTIYPEGKQELVQFQVDEGGNTHTLKLYAKNFSRFDVELGLEVNGVRPAPARLPVEKPVAL